MEKSIPSSGKISLQILVTCSLLIGMAVVMNRFLGVNNQVVQISLNFVPIFIAAAMYGPIMGGTCAALADVIGSLLFPFGAYFFPFTVSAFLTGLIFGLFTYKKFTFLRLTMAVVTVALIVELAMGTAWLMIITDKGFMAIFTARLIKIGILIPLEIGVLYGVRRLLDVIIRKRSRAV